MDSLFFNFLSACIPFDRDEKNDQHEPKNEENEQSGRELAVAAGLILGRGQIWGTVSDTAPKRLIQRGKNSKCAFNSIHEQTAARRGKEQNSNSPFLLNAYRKAGFRAPANTNQQHT